ncbi:uncharacterized protein UTRI_10436 [Ustilago trichophora]|uniref:Uncharacterized protein n=1 Tax=Ustilago trichophora TaxID=86804 RepID=A0A5C3EDT0_9BASI|nr:uncharacterized protein UTRI_10436 [Ustilago trichophora]
MVVPRFCLLLCTTLVLLLAVQVLAFDYMEPEDFAMWKKAKKDIREKYGDVTFLHDSRGLEPFKHIEDLQERLLVLAKEEGGLKGAIMHEARGSSFLNNRKMWFTTVIHPNDRIASEMQLHGKLALAFWRRDKVGNTLIDISFAPYHQHVNLGLESLDSVLAHVR